MPSARVTLGGLQAGLDPRQLPGIQLWIDPKQINGFQQALPADNTPLASVTDLSGVGHNFQQLTATRQPPFRNTGGLTYIGNDGNDDYLSAVAAWNLGSVAESIYIVYGHGSGNPSTGYIWQTGGGALRTHIQIQAVGGPGNYYTNLAAQPWVGNAPLDSSPHLWAAWNDGVDTSYTQRDSGVLSSGTGKGPGALTAAPLIGITTIPNSNLGGRWYEILIYTRFHDKAIRRRVAEWIAKRNKVTLARPT